MTFAAAFAKRFTARQGLLTLAGFVAFALLAPLVLRFGRSDAIHVAGRVAAIALAATLLVTLSTHLLLRPRRFALRALAMGSSAIEETDVETLRRVPVRAIVRQLAVMIAASASFAFPPVRPLELSAEAARELATFGVTVALAVAVPSLVLAQRHTGRLLESAPLDPVTASLEALEERGAPRRATRRNLVFAVVVPVALVGVGGVLATFAHLRALTEQSRTETALTLTRGVVGSGDTMRSPGQTAAIGVAKKLGYDVSLAETEGDAAAVRTAQNVRRTVPLERGSATVAFEADLPVETTLPLAALALVFVALAAAAAYSLAGLVSRDLASSAERLRTLGTERVLAGASDVGFVARLSVVGRLGEAALALAGRFRVFAAAQERALEAKEAARRTRGLLFASVSHDLKTPLNAILGFADSIDRSELSAPQRESLDLISTRGRELVALIETILDAARVEAGQLALSKRRLEVATVVAHAARRARDLAGDAGELRIEIAEGLPLVDVDPVHLPRALGVILAHALRAPGAGGRRAQVVVRAALAPTEKRVRIEVDHGETSVTADELRELFVQKSQTRAKGLTLGLSLARAIFVLHGGGIEVTGAARETPVVLALLPVEGPRSSPPAQSG